VANIAPVGTTTLGASTWGQLDMVGELYEWNLDWLATSVDPCPNCGYLVATNGRVNRVSLCQDTLIGQASCGSLKVGGNKTLAARRGLLLRKMMPLQRLSLLPGGVMAACSRVHGLFVSP